MKRNFTIMIGLLTWLTVFSQETVILNTTITGTKEYKAQKAVILQPGFSYTPTGNNTFRAWVDFFTNPFPNDATGGPVSGLNGIVGNTEGNLTVSPSGSATYEIPVKLPPGTGGMTPDLSIIYSSQAGDGYMGMGFSLSGLSEIVRTPGRSFLDGANTPTLQFNGNDRFVVDGQQLMCLNSYGYLNSEYRTENNEFSRIKSVNGSIYLPASFIVWTKSGLIYEYGTTDNSRVKLSNGKVVRWLLDRVTDTKGNYFTITYDNDAVNGACYPLRIDYTGNSTVTPALQPYCSVRFSYSSRPATNLGYTLGDKMQITKKLDYIRAYYDQTIVKTYHLQYNSNYTLKSVQESGKDGTQYNPTTFEWYNNNNFTPTQTIYDSPSNLSKAEYTFGDFNGDGKMDIVATPMRGAAWREWRVFLSTGTSFTYSSSRNEGNDFKPEALKDYQRLVYTGDFNGDGKTDILVCNRYNNYYNYRVHLSTGSGFETPYLLFSTDRADHEIRIGDCNGNGIADINVFYKVKKAGSPDHELYRYEYPGSPDPYYKAVRYLPSGVVWDKIETGDFNGDGLMDVLNLYSGGYMLGINDGSNPMQSPTTGAWPDKDHHVYLGDFNGDGKTDMLVTGWKTYKWPEWQIRYGNGNGFEDVANAALINSKFDTDTKQIIVCDINGDGRDDFIAVYKTSLNDQLRMIDIYLANNTGTNFSQTNGFRAYGTDIWRFQPADFNGDGRADILCSSLTGTWNGYQMYNTPSDKNMLLKKITDGIGFEQEIIYKKMTDSDVYQPMGTHTYPLSNFMAPLNLVYETKSSDGIGGWATTRYKYAGARVHKKGKGFLGFTEFSVTDVLTNTTTTSTFEVETKRYASALKKTETKVGAKLVSSTEYDNKLKTYNGTSDTYKTIYTYLPVKVTDNKYEYSSSTATPFQTTITRYQYDEYGNIDRTSIRYSDTDSVVNINTYDNTIATDKWHLGRLRTATVTKYSSGQPAVTNTSEFVYDSASGLLIEETVQPTDSLGYQKTYKHDAYGNIKQTTTKGVMGSQLNTSRTQYSDYDSKGRFVTAARNSYGHQESQVIDPFLGAKVSKTSSNGLTTEYKFDGFGQNYGGTSPDGNHSVTHLFWNKNHSDAPAQAVYYAWTESSGSPPALTFYDKLGRERRQAVTGFDGRLIYTDTEYNSKGQVYRTSEPYFKGETQLRTTYEYDGMGRVTKYNLPDGSAIKTAYNGLTTTVTNPLNQIEEKTIDAQGRLNVSKDNSNGTVTYTYNANGNVTKVQGPRTTIYMQYDAMGNLTKMKDPDMGDIEYGYNIFGETLYRKHLGKTLPATTFAYDSLGRMIQQVEPEGITTWIYDTKKTGMLSSVTHSVTGAGQEYFYDQWCRVTKVKENISSDEFYETATTYDRYGRTDLLTYPNNALTVQQVYNTYGYLQQVKNAGTGTVYWTAQQMNARGQLEKFLSGNGLQTTRTYQASTGHLQTIKTPKAGGGFIQNWSYNFDAVGNLIQRKDIARNKWEDFEYDNLNRLIKVKHNNTLNLEMAYDAAGNMTKKTDLGNVSFDYQDGTNRLEHIIATGTMNYNQGNQRVSYTSFDKVCSIGMNNDSLHITYGTAQQRIRATTCNAAGMTAQRTYVGALYEKEFNVSTAEIKHIFYIFAGGGAVAIHTISNTAGSETVYLHKDHLGSIAAITDAEGTLKQELSYDAWGNRRDPVTWAMANVTPLFARGFTGHEHLDLFALVNMNGRMYDPALGRFLSPDPYMQAPDFTQGLNRYIYCLNNPLSLTDPSGYSWLSDNWKSLVASAVGIAVSVVTVGAGTGFSIAIIAGAAGGAAGSMTGALLNGANFGQIMKAGATGAFWGAVGSAASFGVGQLKFDNIVGKMLTHGVSQGALTASQGGKFQHGFFAAAFTAGLAPGIQKRATSNFGKVIASSIVGGTASALGGGKFANGAITGAYVMLFNHVRHEKLQDELNKVFENYPMDGNNEISTQEAFKRVSPAVEKLYLDGDQNYQNACATRLSLAFAEAGIKIPSGYGGLKDVNGNRIIISASQMQKFMSAKYGSLMTTYSKSTSTNGIYIGLTKSGMGYSGHVTIIKSSFNSNTYSSTMRAMYFWAIP